MTVRTGWWGSLCKRPQTSNQGYYEHRSCLVPFQPQHIASRLVHIHRNLHPTLVAIDEATMIKKTGLLSVLCYLSLFASGSFGDSKQLGPMITSIVNDESDCMKDRAFLGLAWGSKGSEDDWGFFCVFCGVTRDNKETSHQASAETRPYKGAMTGLRNSLCSELSYDRRWLQSLNAKFDCLEDTKGPWGNWDSQSSLFLFPLYHYYVPCPLISLVPVQRKVRVTKKAKPLIDEDSMNMIPSEHANSKNISSILRRLAN